MKYGLDKGWMGIIFAIPPVFTKNMRQAWAR